jgi:hypothetical protein
VTSFSPLVDSLPALSLDQVLVFDTPLTDPQAASLLLHLQAKYSISKATGATATALAISTPLQTPVKEVKAIALVTDTESEVEITRSGVKTTLHRETDKPMTAESIKAEPISPSDEGLKEVPQLKQVTNVKDEFALERLEAEQHQRVKKQSTVEKIPPVRVKDVLDEQKTELVREEEKTSSSSQPLDADRLRPSIVDGPSAGVGSGGDRATNSKEGSVCSTNVDPYKGLPIDAILSLSLLTSRSLLSCHLLSCSSGNIYPTKKC